MKASDRIKEIVHEEAIKKWKQNLERRPVEVYENALRGDPRFMITVVIKYLDEKEAS